MNDIENDFPLVSILIPAYKPDFFEHCLDSALAQTYSNFEVIVSDDCPTNAIGDIVNRKNDRRIRYCRNEPANGPMFNYVESFKLANGEYIKYLNDDDILDPQCLEKMVPELKARSVSLVTTYRQEIDENSEMLSDRLHNEALFTDNVVVEGCSLAASMLMHRLNFVGEPSCTLFRKKDLEMVEPHLMCFGGSGYERSGLGDVGLVLNLLKAGDCIYLGENPLVKIRVFDGQWQAQSKARLWSIESWRVFRLHAIAYGMFHWFSLGWKLRYKKRQELSWRSKWQISFPLLKHQLGWMYRSLKD